MHATSARLPARASSPSALLLDRARITFAGAPASFDSLFTARFNNESAHGASEDAGDKFDLAELQRYAAAASDARILMDKKVNEVRARSNSPELEDVDCNVAQYFILT